MPVYNLQCCAECENVATISGDTETIWRMKVECSSCQDVSPNFIEVSSTEEVEVPGTRGVCNCLYACKCCKRKIQIDVLPKSLVPTSVETWGTVASFEIRGGKPSEFQAADGFTVISAGEVEFKNADLSEDFSEYDENSGECVSLLDIKWRFE